MWFATKNVLLATFKTLKLLFKEKTLYEIGH